MVADMIARQLSAPNQSFFLFGIRGTGKSTWVRAQYPKAYRIDLLDESLYQAYLARISLFADELRALEAGSWAFVDEIQRLPSLLNEVHRFLEERRLKFILTGSSARKLRRGGVNLLGGRALRRTMYPFTPLELGRDFDITEVLTHGSLPLIWTSPDRKEALEAYVQLYLKEEIQAEAIVRNLPGFARFLPIAALFHAQTLNISSLARDAGVSRTTVSGYIEILEDTLVAFRLPAFEGKLRVRERKHPKLYWIDPGLVRAARKSLDALSREEAGPLLEGWVAVLLRMHCEYDGLFDEMHYWAPADGALEVDFLLSRGKEFLALEVKNGESLQPQHLRGLHAISDLKGVKRRMVVYRGAKRLRLEDGIEALPLETFIELLRDGKL